MPADPASGDAVTIPFEAPEPGSLVALAPGLMWARVPLPYAPGHMNAYLIEDADGWCAVDVGLMDEATLAAWERIVDALPGRRRLSRILVTHWHSDHLGAAGALCRRHDAPLVMSEAEYLKGLALLQTPRAHADATERAFFGRHGLAGEELRCWVADGHRYLRMMAPLPATYQAIAAGDRLTVGRRDLTVHIGRGHSPEEVMLLPRGEPWMISADHMCPRMPLPISVESDKPDDDPLARMQATHGRMLALGIDDHLLLPGHESPFRGLRARVAELRAYHDGVMAKIEAACRERPRSARDIVDVLHRRTPGPTWIGFIVSGVVTHLNHLERRGRVRKVLDGDILRFTA